ncbi:hypothetical protein ADILRU_0258 [Leifsonia rubra CMS 76R]|nr:hypothetical protein ADILRU_0258 [Leifsonia rubra CMS 76R]
MMKLFPLNLGALQSRVDAATLSRRQPEEPLRANQHPVSPCDLSA